MRYFNIFKVIILYILFSCATAHGAWTGPAQVLTGGWGSGPAEFNKKGHPPYVTLPILHDISSAGQIVIADKLNGRIKIYGADGVLIRNITPPVARPKRWTMVPNYIGQNVLIPLDKYYIYSNGGELISQSVGPDDDDYIREYNNKLYVHEISPDQQWHIYSPDGTLLNVYPDKPLELAE